MFYKPSNPFHVHDVHLFKICEQTNIVNNVVVKYFYN